MEYLNKSGAQPVEGPREPCVHEAVDRGDRLECPKCGLVLARYTPAAPVEGVERVTDDAPARVEPQPCLFQDYAGEGNIAFCELPVGHDNGVHEPVAQPAKHTDDRPADTIPEDERKLYEACLAWDKSGKEHYVPSWKVRNLLERTGGAETRIEVLEAALQWMSRNRALTIFIETEEHVANFFEKCDAALAAPSQPTGEPGE